MDKKEGLLIKGTLFLHNHGVGNFLQSCRDRMDDLGFLPMFKEKTTKSSFSQTVIPQTLCLY